MSKGLEALENIKHYDNRVGLHEDDYKIIESTLKDYEKLKDEYDRLVSIHTEFIKQYNQLMNDHSKILKALGIIKKYYEVCECYNHQYIMTDHNGGCVELTQEEYDLLKEILNENGELKL